MSSSGTLTPVLPAYIAGNRFAPVSEANHAAPVWISTLLCLVYSTLVLIIRAHLKLNAFSLDDYIIFFSTVLQTGEVVALIVALQYGLGKSHLFLSEDDLSNTNKATFAGIILFIASTCFAKLSVISLMMRLFNLSGPRANTDSRSRILWFTFLAAFVIASVWGAGSIIALSIDCSIPFFTSNGSCPAQNLRWDVIGAIDISTEILLVVLSVIIVWPVQLNLSTKTSIVLAFTFRLPCAALSAIHIFYIHQYTKSSTTTPATTINPGLALVPVLVIMQIQLCWSVLSATIPNLRSFVRSFNGSFGHHLDLDSINASKHDETSSASRSRSRSRASKRLTTPYELELAQTTRKASSATNSTTLYAFAQPPARPSRLNVDIEGIGWHAGIPAIPGFGAGGYVGRIESGVGITPDQHRASTARNETMRSARFEDMVIADHGVEYRDDSGNHREGVIRKDMQYEVRYEMA